MFAMFSTIFTVYLVGRAYLNGRRDGSRRGWSAAWRKLRRRSQR